MNEAWGAHLPFHPDLPAWAMDVGADVCVTSVHKMGSGLEQGSGFHLQGDLITKATLASRADVLGTTSPSVLIYAGLDGWRRQMVEHGHDLYEQTPALARDLRTAAKGIDGLHVNDCDDFCATGRAFDMDPLQVFIDLNEIRVNGYDAADWIREHHHINFHLSDHRRISAQLTHADDETTTARLLTGLRDLVTHAGQLRPAPPVDIPEPRHLRLDQADLPRDAFFGKVEQVPADKAVGRICAEMLTPYPPGIPAALPGERLNQAVVDYLRSGVQSGMVVPDAADAGLDTLRVSVEDALVWVADLRRQQALTGRGLLGGILLGAGFFQLYDGTVQHKILRLHQICYQVDLVAYDWTWNVLAVVFLVIGALLVRVAARRLHVSGADESAAGRAPGR